MGPAVCCLLYQDTRYVFFFFLTQAKVHYPATRYGISTPPADARIPVVLFHGTMCVLLFHGTLCDCNVFSPLQANGQCLSQGTRYGSMSCLYHGPRFNAFAPFHPTAQPYTPCPGAAVWVFEAACRCMHHVIFEEFVCTAVPGNKVWLNVLTPPQAKVSRSVPYCTRFVPQQQYTREAGTTERDVETCR